MEWHEPLDVLALVRAPPERDAGGAGVQLELADRVVVGGATDEPPGRGRIGDSRQPAPVARRARPPGAEPVTATMRRSLSVRGFRNGEQTIWKTRRGAAAELDLADIRVVHVASENDDRRRGGDAGLAAGDVPQPAAEAFERRVERGPVLQVDCRGAAARSARRRRAPAPVAQRFVPRLEVVDAVRKEDRQRARDHEMVELAARVVDDPVPFLLVDHVAPPLGEHARGARVEHEEPRVAEVAVVGPAARGGLAVPRRVRAAAARAGVVRRLRPRRASAPRRAPAARDCRCAGRSSTP